MDRATMITSVAEIRVRVARTSYSGYFEARR
jgi:hypothetical protein